MSKRLFVGNLSFDVTEEELQTAFAQYGASGATIPTHDNGRPKGFGFVDIGDDQLQAAIDGMEGKSLRGRPIAVNEARPRTEARTWGNRSEGRGGGFGGGYGGGGGRRGGGGYGGGGGGGRGGNGDGGGGGGGGRW